MQFEKSPLRQAQSDGDFAMDTGAANADMDRRYTHQILLGEKFNSSYEKVFLYCKISDTRKSIGQLLNFCHKFIGFATPHRMFLLLAFFAISVPCAFADLDVYFTSPPEVNLCESNLFVVRITAVGTPASELVANITLPVGFSYDSETTTIVYPGDSSTMEPIGTGNHLKWDLSAIITENDHLVINEFETNPEDGDYGNEWVELYNPTYNDVNIGEWKLVNGDADEYTIPAETTIMSKGFWVHTFKGYWLDNSDESIALYNASVMVDKTSTIADSKNDNQCWARNPNGYDSDSDLDWQFQDSTKGSSNGDLFPGSIITINFNLTANCSATSGQCLKADISYDGGSAHGDSSTIAVAEGVLRLTKTPALMEASVDEVVSWLTTIENSGAAPIFNVIINETLSSGLELESIDSPSGELNWSYEKIDAGAHRTVNMTARVVSCYDLYSLACGTWGCDDVCQETSCKADVNIKSGLGKLPDYQRDYTIGEPVDFAITVDMPAGTVHDLWINDTLPKGLIYNSSSLAIDGAALQSITVGSPNDGSQAVCVNWSFGDVDNSADQDMTIAYSAIMANVNGNQEGTSLTNGVSLHWKDDGGSLHTGYDESGPVNVVEPDLLIVKSATPQAGDSGDLITYIVSACHSTDSHTDAFEVDIWDFMPPGMNLVPGSMEIYSGPEGTIDDDNPAALRWHFDRIDTSWNGANKVLLRYNATIEDDVSPGDSLINYATVTWTSTSKDNPNERDGSGGVDDYNQTTSSHIETMTLILEIMDRPDPVSVGELLSYSIKFEVIGNTNATNVTIRENYDPNVVFVSSDPVPSNSDNDIWTSASAIPHILEPDGPHYINITAQVLPPLQNGSIIQNEVTLTSDQLKDTKTFEDTEVLSPVLIINKIAYPDPVEVGELLNYTIIYQNIGLENATNTTIMEDYDPNVVFISSDPAPSSGENNIWNTSSGIPDPLEPDGVHFINITVRVLEGMENGTLLKNDFTIDCKETDPTSGTIYTNTLNSTKLAVNKTALKKSVKRGEEITYLIQICNKGGIPAKNVVARDVFDKDVEFISASPAPDNDGIWRFDQIANGTCVSITLVVRVPRPVVEFKMDHSAAGNGFVNLANDYSTTFQPYLIRNYVYVNSNESNAMDSESVFVLGEDGTELQVREHGSGSYDSCEQIRFMTENKSIQMNKTLSASHYTTKFNLPVNRSVNLTSRWSSLSRAKNLITSTSMHESYRYADKIDRISYMLLDENGSVMIIDSDFDGIAHVEYLKKSDANSSDQAPLIYQTNENYAGSFRVFELVEEHHSNVASDRSAKGSGFVDVENKVKENQKSHETGTGPYEVNEKIRTHTNYINKEIQATYKPSSLIVTPYSKMDVATLWNEGIWSKNEGISFIGQEFGRAEYLEIETVAGGLGEMNTEADFTGRAAFRAILNGEVDTADEFRGNYSIKRSVSLAGIPSYMEPHISISKGAVWVDNTSILDYAITVQNDGNRALGPLYVKDIFPPGAVYLDASVVPSQLTSTHANWTLMHLPTGGQSTIHLWLNMTEYGGQIVNRVEAVAGQDGQWIYASNFSSLEMDWLTCCPEEISFSKTGTIDPIDPAIVWFTIEIENLADSPMAAHVKDELPKGMRFLNASLVPAEYDSCKVTWSLADIAPGEKKTIVYRSLALWNGVFVNRAHVDAHFVDGSDSVSFDACADIVIRDVEDAVARSGWQPPKWDFNNSLEMSEFTCEQFCERT